MKRLLSKRKNNKLEYMNKNELYKDLYANFPDGLFLINLSGEFMDCNEGLETLTGISKDHLLYSHFRNFIHSEDLFDVNKYFQHALKGKIQDKEFRVLHKSGNIRYVNATFVPANVNGKILGVYGAAKDITDKKHLEMALKDSEIWFESLIQHSSDVIGVLDDKGIIKYQSSSVKKLLGYEPNTLMGTNGFDIVYKNDLKKAQDIFDKVLKSGNLTEKTELRIKKADGNLIFCEVYVTNLLMDDRVNRIVVNYRDISERKSYEQEIYRMAYHDYLTGLPNRFMLETSLSEEIEKSMDLNNNLAVLLIDLDRFKVVNDSIGHHAGDLLLKAVSNRLKETIDGKGTLFRQGGDEFIIILTDANREVASIVSERILSSLAQPFTMNHIEIFTSPSIGITMVPEDGNSVDQILRNADFAMYQAKRNGKNRYHFYSPSKSSNLLNPLKMEMELHRAVERDELTLHYQPKINLQTGEIVGVEALIRWNHPEWGMVSPGNFIPLAEETGLIIPIGVWAVKTACQQNKIWHSKGFTTVVSVNLSARQFTQLSLVQSIQSALEESGLKPQFLELEITESMTANIEQSIKTLNDLKELGVKISIDDFGTGFSSLNYLKEFPVDTLKIDQSFVRELSNNSSDKTIVKTIISMAHNLNLNVVAEGIETKEQLVFLQQHLCNEGQGFLFSKPVPANELEKSIHEIKQTVKTIGISHEVSERLWADELLLMARKELENTVRLQQGLTLQHSDEPINEMEDHFQLIAKNMTELIRVLDVNGNTRYVSPSHTNVLGHKLRYFEENSVFEHIHPDDQPLIKETFKLVVQNKKASSLEFRYLHEKGHWVLLECSLSPITSKDGDIKRIVIIGRDITEKRRTDEMIRKAEKLEVVSELAAGIAHEIRNPITSIKGYVHLLEQGIIKPEYFDVIHSSCNDMEGIINGFLDIAKPQIIQQKRVNIPKLLENVVTLIQTNLYSKSIEIHLEVDEDIPLINCDPVQMKQVFMNLLTNSIEAISNQGTIKLYVNIKDSNLKIKVIDNGIGMSEDRLKKLGEPFYCIKEKGIGLGLMLSYRIIWQHNGTICVQSAENIGTTVEVTLPIVVKQNSLDNSGVDCSKSMMIY
ncbi:EAL domain-containing protein [Alkalihalobacillus sp. BA299]|uniref:EAL domain-containing protein n=1 Tax=Alkalihalobacillus sp. BA299 TaxID=2815938 RepID=UPI001ADC1D31|nr:EAL domain-containing protein [Alkalihalobacillus sp. BA299]